MNRAGVVEDGPALLDFERRRMEAIQRMGGILEELKSAVGEDGSKLALIASELEDGVRSVRLLPLSTLFSLFPRMVRDLARSQSKSIDLIVEGGETTADKRIIEEMKDPLMHMIRNAVDHGIETPEAREEAGKPPTAVILLKASQTASSIVIEIRDDGRGLDTQAIQKTAVRKKLRREEELAGMETAQIHSLIFAPGFSTSTFISDVSGRGVGLDVVRANVERLKGIIRVASMPGRGCAFTIQLPVTIATTRVLIVETRGVSYAVPVEFVKTTRRVHREEIFTLDGRGAMMLFDKPVSVARLSTVLELPEQQIDAEAHATPCIVVTVGDESLALLVDTVADEQEIVLKRQSRLLKRVRNISGATILGTGRVCMVLNAVDLIKSSGKRGRSIVSDVGPAEEERKKVILLAEDSITTRTQMKRILESAGYEVTAAVDGLDAFNKLGGNDFDAVVSDVQMPNLDGLSLAAKIRQDPRYREVPIILVTSLSSDDDKKAGIEAGANAYIPKPTFDQNVLLDTLRRLI